MKIDSIKKLSNNKYKIKLDNNETISLYDDVIINNNLLYKKEISDNILHKLREENSYYEIYNKIIKLISNRIRSEKEINDYLEKFELSEDLKINIIDRLKSNNYINDNNFVRSYISDKIYLSSSGPLKIRKELLDHNIDEVIIDEELGKVDINVINDKMNKIIMKKFKANNKYSDYVFKQKVITEMINLGYEKNNIISVLNNIEVDNASLINKDYLKIYNKLKNKYKDTELIYKVKQKLYQKGYNSEDINNIFNQ